MTHHPKITMIGAGSTVFMKNLVGDILHLPCCADAEIALQDVDASRLEDSEIVARKIVDTLGVGATVRSYSDHKAALEGADFVIVAFQIGGYEPCTVTDFQVPKKYGLRQTIADTLGIGGIMRGLRTVPHLLRLCDEMRAVAPAAWLLNYVNPMAINMWAMGKLAPDIKQVGLCHSVQGTAKTLARDLDIDAEDVRYVCAGVNHMAFYLRLEQRMPDGRYRDLYPDLDAAYRAGRAPKVDEMHPNCPNLVRYDLMTRLGYFVTESSEHFAEYTPWYIKRDRPDLLEKYGVPLDEYPRRCLAQIERWNAQSKEFREARRIKLGRSHEYASQIVNSLWTGAPSVIYGNVMNREYITNLPKECCVEVPCLVDATGIQPTAVGDLPPQLAALVQTSINVQSLTVAAIERQDPALIYHAAMMDPHTAAELDLDQIRAMVDELIETHGAWLPDWCGGGGAPARAA
jgi:alpha-galactosidase